MRNWLQSDNPRKLCSDSRCAFEIEHVFTASSIAAPVLAGLGAIAALIASFTIGVEKVKEEATEVGSEDGQPGKS